MQIYETAFQDVRQKNSVCSALKTRIDIVLTYS